MKRRKKLKEKWFFDCNCKRCDDPTDLGSHVSTLRCSEENCSDGLVMAGKGEDSVCDKCQKVYEPEAIDKIENEYVIYYYLSAFNAD